MKIGFVLDDRLDKPDGVQQYVKLLAKWLTSEGHEVHFLVGNSPDATEKNVHSLGKTVGVRFNKNRMAIPLPASKKAIQHLLSHEHFDVLHVQMPYSPLLAGRVVAAAEETTAVIGTFHILPHGKLSAFGTKALGVLLRRNKRRFDTFFSVSSAAQHFALSHFGVQSSVLPNVVELANYKKGSPITALAGKQNIVFLGRFVERKGAHHLLSAYKALLIAHADLRDTVRLVLCGDGPDRTRLEKQADAIRQLGGEVLFTGFLPEEEKKNYLASATIAAFPSTGGESFGIVLIEAMAAGSLVVLGGNNDGYMTVLGDEPRSIVAPEQHTVFADRLYDFLTNDTQRRQVHDKQQETVRLYDIEHVGPKLVAEYSAALARRAHKRNT